MPIEGLIPGPVNGQPPLNLSVHTQPNFDPIDLLPQQAAERLRMLRLRAKETHALVPPYEDIRESSAAKTNAENALRRLQAPAQEFGHNLKPDSPLVAAAQRTLDKLSADFNRLTELQKLRGAAWQSSSQALAKVQDWLKSGRPQGVTLEDVDTPVKLAKGEVNWIDAVEARRRRAREIKADLARIAAAPFPSAYCKERMRAEVEALATIGAPSVSLLVERGGKIDWSLQRVQAEVYGVERAFAFHEAVDPVGLLCWLFKDAMIAALEGEIATEACDGEALTIEERQRRESELLGDLLAQEMLEGAATWRAIDAGLPIEFKADIDPRAVLQIKMVTLAKPKWLEPTSPGHAYDLVRGGR
jgi:hypothetical protein